MTRNTLIKLTATAAILLAATVCFASCGAIFGSDMSDIEDVMEEYAADSKGEYVFTEGKKSDKEDWENAFNEGLDGKISGEINEALSIASTTDLEGWCVVIEFEKGGDASHVANTLEDGIEDVIACMVYYRTGLSNESILAGSIVDSAIEKYTPDEFTVSKFGNLVFFGDFETVSLIGRMTGHQSFEDFFMNPSLAFFGVTADDEYDEDRVEEDEDDRYEEKW